MTDLNVVPQPLTRPLTVRLDADLLKAAKMKAVESDLTMTEIVSRLLTAYVAGKVNVAKRETDATPTG